MKKDNIAYHGIQPCFMKSWYNSFPSNFPSFWISWN